MKLFALGVDTFSQSRSTSATPSDFETPSLSAKAIKVLWSSWCDVVIARQDDINSWFVEYRGTSLAAAQEYHLMHAQAIKDILNKDGTVKFFGSTMHDGVHGVVIPERKNNKTSFFFNTVVAEPAAQGLALALRDSEYETIDIKVTNAGDMLVSMKKKILAEEAEECITLVNDLVQLRHCLASNAVPSLPTLALFAPTQWCLNATTATALDGAGRVHTRTRDPRYPKCFARPYEGIDTFEPVPFLSETQIRQIASGGYMTAAVSVDGELFLWGQACPGAIGELDVLQENTVPNVHDDDGIPKGTGISVEDDQDELVKCLTVRIDNEEAIVYDVAVGFGHVLVAARSAESGKQAVFAAGDNSRGQSGLSTKREFVEAFEELTILSGKNIAQLVATGWSSFVVMEDR